MPEEIKPKKSVNKVILVMYGLEKGEYRMGFSAEDQHLVISMKYFSKSVKAGAWSGCINQVHNTLNGVTVIRFKIQRKLHHLCSDTS